MYKQVCITDNLTYGRNVIGYPSQNMDIVAVDMRRLTEIVGESMIAEFGSSHGQEVLEQLRSETASQRDAGKVLMIYYRALVTLSGKLFNFEAVTCVIFSEAIYNNDPVFGMLMKGWFERQHITPIFSPSAA